QGVLIMGLGIFCVVQEPLRLGAEEVLMVRRPVFKLAMNPACHQWLKYPKVTLTENIEIEPLDFRLLTLATSLPRPVVEDCVDETVLLFSSHMKHMENVAFVFKDIGVLACQGGSLQMKFFGSCIEQLETTTSLTAALRS
ncbi:CCD81 protein, partial [Nothoprocta ornata]|nr:CCD81 protein [Nothoprocta pentlandii]NWX98889.1 CCD81 protein [Nothoprocta ornata]